MFHRVDIDSGDSPRRDSRSSWGRRRDVGTTRGYHTSGISKSRRGRRMEVQGSVATTSRTMDEPNPGRPIRVRISVLPPLGGSDRGEPHVSISGLTPGATRCHSLRGFGRYRRDRKRNAKTNTSAGRPCPPDASDANALTPRSFRQHDINHVALDGTGTDTCIVASPSSSRDHGVFMETRGEGHSCSDKRTPAPSGLETKASTLRSPG